MLEHIAAITRQRGSFHSALKMEAVHSAEILVVTHETTTRHIPERVSCFCFEALSSSAFSTSSPPSLYRPLSVFVSPVVIHIFLLISDVF